MSDSAVFALALHHVPGIGRISVGRLLAHFDGYEALLAYPHEQIQTRLRGIPSAAALTSRLLDRALMDEAIAAATKELGALRSKGITPLTCKHTHWPVGLDDLEPRHRPTILYAYGPLDALTRPAVSILARPPLAPPPFELAQDLVRQLPAYGAVPATAALSGFDVVVLKLATDASPPSPSVIVASTGLARVSSQLRPAISAAVKAGGVLVSPFPMDHGPFEHDQRESALLLAALGRAVVVVDPRPDTPEWDAVDWSSTVRRPLFGMTPPDTPLPSSIHPLMSSSDFEWVRTAVDPDLP